MQTSKIDKTMKSTTTLIFLNIIYFLAFLFSPLHLSLAFACTPTSEICGDGIDQDCNGTDLQCPGLDGDMDGYTLDSDCSDLNRYIYPGVSTPCTASCGDGVKTCQTSGSYSTCSCTPLCEATGNGRCYYISAKTGSDSNPGTFTSPWKTHLNFVSYYTQTETPPNAVRLNAGDVVYFLSGFYRDTYTYDNTTKTIFLFNIQGTPSSPVTLKAYPGHKPVIWPLGKASGLWVFYSHNIVIDGLEVMGASGQGVMLEETSGVEVRNIRIHETDGVDNDNIAGLYTVDVKNLNLHHNWIHDNYDRTNADTGGQKTENSRNIVLFGGGNTVRLHHNVIYQTPPTSAAKTGACLAYKHGASISASTFEVDHNMLWNCFFNSIGSGTQNSHIHHNLILNSHPIKLKDHGGATNINNVVVENNTIVGGVGLSYEPTDSWNPIGLVTYKNNIVTDSATYSEERGMITIHPYGSDTLYNKTVNKDKLVIDSNCYHNSNTSLKWVLFAANGGSFGNLGSLHNLTSWKTLGYDLNSTTVNPQLDTNYIPRNSTCTGFGHWAQ